MLLRGTRELSLARVCVSRICAHLRDKASARTLWLGLPRFGRGSGWPRGSRKNLECGFMIGVVGTRDRNGKKKMKKSEQKVTSRCVSVSSDWTWGGRWAEVDRIRKGSPQICDWEGELFTNAPGRWMEGEMSGAQTDSFGVTKVSMRKV